MVGLWINEKGCCNNLLQSTISVEPTPSIPQIGQGCDGGKQDSKDILGLPACFAPAYWSMLFCQVVFSFLFRVVEAKGIEGFGGPPLSQPSNRGVGSLGSCNGVLEESKDRGV